jgi:hypothetical protein
MGLAAAGKAPALGIPLETLPEVREPHEKPGITTGTIELLNFELTANNNLRPLRHAGRLDPIDYGFGKQEVTGLLDVYVSGDYIDKLQMILLNGKKVPLYFVMPGTNMVCTGDALFSQSSIMGGYYRPNDMRITIDFYVLNLEMRERKPFEGKGHSLAGISL